MDDAPTERPSGAGRGWYRDPAARHEYRWHDGQSWTAFVADADRQTTDPVGTASDAGDPAGEEVWLPPPFLLTGKRVGPVAASRPSYGFESTPEGGYEPVSTGNRLLDLNQNYVNEFESRMRRESSLLVSSVAALRALPVLRPLGVVLAAVSLAFVAAVAVSGTLVVRALWPRTLAVFVAAAVVPAAIAALYLVLPILNVAAFGAAVSVTLTGLDGDRPRVGTALRGVRRSMGGLVRLYTAFLSQFMPFGTLVRFLYEAGAVFAVPVQVADATPYRSAQDRSEELVRVRWGPGRYRAFGLPKMSPWTYLYTRSRLRWGYSGPFLAVVPIIAFFVAPVIVAVVSESPAVIGGAFAICYGSMLLGWIVWFCSVAPLLRGVLRAHLYRYALTGVAEAPYLAPALHACLREEMRATIGWRQREPTDVASAPGGGLPGTARSAIAEGMPYLEREAGVPVAALGDIVRDGLHLYRDGKAVQRALRGAGGAGLDAGALMAATGLDRGRCRATVVNLIYLGKARACPRPDGTTVYEPAR